MAAVAQIIIEVDQQGATKAFQQINAEAGKLGPTLQPVARISEATFNNIEGGALKARESAALLGEEFGFHIPRALRGVLAQSTIIGPALTTAFNTLAIVGFVQILVNAAEQFGAFTSKIRDGGRDLVALEEAVIKTSRTMQGPQSFTEMAAQVGKTEFRVAELRKELGLTGDFLPGLVAPVRRLGAEFNYSYLELQRLEKDLPGLQAQLDQLADASKRTEPVEILKLQNQARLAGLQGITKINEEERGATENLRAEIAKRIKHEAIGQAEIDNVSAQGAAKRKEYERSVTETIIQLQNQAAVVGLSQVRQLVVTTDQEIDKIQRLYEADKISFAQMIAEKTAIADAGTKKYVQLQHDVIFAGDQAILQATAASFAGRTQIEKEYAAKIHQIEEEELKSGIDMTRQKTAAEIEEKNKLLNLAHQRADEEIQIETEAAIAMLPPWRRADAQIVLAAEDRIRKIQEIEAKDNTFFEQGEREKAAIMQKEWHDRVENMASQLEGLYNEITSGGIGQFFLKRFKHMLFEMVAAWILGMNQMRAASQQQMGGSGQGGGFLGAIFGALGLGGIFGGGGGTTPDASASVLQNLGMMSGMPSFSGGGMSGSGETSSESGGFGSSLFGALGLSAGGGGGSGTILPSGAGPGGKAAGGLQGLLGNLFSNEGGITGSLFGLGGLALLSATFRRGGILGGLGGALGGAMLGTAILPGIGTLIGAIVGGIIGIFGKSTKKARLAIEADIKSKSQTIEDSYNLFQTDWTTSRDALEQLRQQGVDALKQAGVKDINRSRVGHVDQWIDKAEKEIDATQAERNRRGAMVFGPAEFRVGGLVGPSLGGPVPAWFAGSAMHFAGGGAVPAFLHEGEYVMRPEAVNRIGAGKLGRMNAGGAGGDVHLHIHMSAIDGPSAQAWLRATGGREIINFLRLAQSEGML